jgi:hypothetical protein
MLNGHVVECFGVVFFFFFRGNVNAGLLFYWGSFFWSTGSFEV